MTTFTVWNAKLVRDPDLGDLWITTWSDRPSPTPIWAQVVRQLGDPLAPFWAMTLPKRPRKPRNTTR